VERISIAVLTISDGVAAGDRDDTSGRAIVDWATRRGMHVDVHTTSPDRTDIIASTLLKMCDSGVDVVLTTGGTGLTARDVTPEATMAVVERSVPGIAEAMRARGAAHTPMAWLSRGIAGTRGDTLIVNLPGSTNGVRDGLAVLDDVVDHAVQLLRGVDTQTHPASSPSQTDG
jgi:molybdenum cofactor synthesis domain-containing protein